MLRYSKSGLMNTKHCTSPNDSLLLNPACGAYDVASKFSRIECNIVSCSEFESYVEEITRLLNSMANNDGTAAEQVLPLIYQELRIIAQQKMAHENKGHTLNATALVHEAYLRLVEVSAPDQEVTFENRRHFFGAAAEAMRRILIESARRKQTEKRGGKWKRVDLDVTNKGVVEGGKTLLEVSETLDELAKREPRVAELVKLRYFTGLTIKEAAEMLGIAPRTADSWWSYARAWLQAELKT